MEHVSLLVEFYKSLKLDEVRVARPDPFIFFCGGVVEKSPDEKVFRSLRDYIQRKPLQLRHRCVLAEDAVKLFQDSRYDDLITFEAHIAQISELVLLICEGPGSLAELGAFCLEKTIVDRLYVIIHDHHLNADSFIRLGPLRVVKKVNSDAVGAFSWDEERGSSGAPEISIDEKFDSVIVQAINSNLAQPKEERFQPTFPGHQMILLYWVCFMLRGATRKELVHFFTQLGMSEAADDIDRFMYCMMVAGWIKEKNVGRPYFLPHHDRDPISYAYLVSDTSNPTKASKCKATIAELIEKEGLRPAQILESIGAGDPVEVLP